MMNVNENEIHLLFKLKVMMHVRCPLSENSHQVKIHFQTFPDIAHNVSKMFCVILYAKQ